MAQRTVTAPCPSCGSIETLRVSLTLSETPVSFAACNVCEWKGWEHEGETLPLSSVLTLVTRR